jgi:hypothetical protein
MQQYNEIGRAKSPIADLSIFCVRTVDHAPRKQSVQIGSAVPSRAN